MDYYASILGSDWLQLGNLAFALVLARAAWTAPWRELWRNNGRFNALIGLAIWLGILWLLPVGVHAGLKLHPLGAALCFLLFGWQIATLMLSSLLLASLLHGGFGLVTLGSLGLVMIAMPIAMSGGLLYLFDRYGKKNYFAFVLWNGYLGGILTMLSVGLLNGFLVVAFGAYSWFTIQNVYLAYLPIISSTESLMTGAIISGFAAFQPDAVAHFDQDEYFVKKPPEDE
ncbi:MAG: energy-coupling factor ABC transporter permease [Nitrosomonadales bacterium]|nr:energy-coupling factor ABC transporter permease [Nitrosomonadales bacterium]